MDWNNLLGNDPRAFAVMLMTACFILILVAGCTADTRPDKEGTTAKSSGIDTATISQQVAPTVILEDNRPLNPLLQVHDTLITSTGLIVISDNDSSWRWLARNKTGSTRMWIPTVRQALNANSVLQQCLLDSTCRETMISRTWQRFLHERMMWADQDHTNGSNSMDSADMIRDTAALAGLRLRVEKWANSGTTTRVFGGMINKGRRFYWIVWKPDVRIDDDPNDRSHIDDNISFSYWPESGAIEIEIF